MGSGHSLPVVSRPTSFIIRAVAPQLLQFTTVLPWTILCLITSLRPRACFVFHFSRCRPKRSQINSREMGAERKLECALSKLDKQEATQEHHLEVGALLRGGCERREKPGRKATEVTRRAVCHRPDFLQQPAVGWMKAGSSKKQESSVPSRFACRSA